MFFRPARDHIPEYEKIGESAVLLYIHIYIYGNPVRKGLFSGKKRHFVTICNFLYFTQKLVTFLCIKMQNSA